MGKGRSRAPAEPGRGRLHRLFGWLPDAVVLVALLLAFAQVQFDAFGRLGLVADPTTEPAAVAPPAGVEIAPQPAAAPVAAPASGDPVAAKVRAALAGAMARSELGRRTTALVTTLDGTVLHRAGSGAITPASNTKILTALAALDALGPETRFRTSVRQMGERPVIFLVGGGDPYLTSTAAEAKGAYPERATVAQLAARTATALRAAGIARVSLRYDDSLFTGPAVNPRWPATYVPEGVVPPIGALWVDQGRDDDGFGYVDDPASDAADVFASALRRQGIRVAPRVVPATAPTGSQSIAHVDSAPLGQVLQRVISASDNNAAEVVLRHLGEAVVGDASFQGGSEAMLQRLEALGVSVAGARIFDGSGLSRDNRLTTQTLVDVLVTAASPANPRLRSVITGLSVAGFEGSLTERFDRTNPFAPGRVMAKTGTLTGVHGLAGIVTDRSGTPMVFAIMTDRVPVAKTLPARLQLDRFAAALAACRCGGP